MPVGIFGRSLKSREVFGDLFEDAELVADITAAYERWCEADGTASLNHLGWNR
jgi:hypothetical protein